MNEYIFYTCEGYTEPPLEGHIVENCQVLGRETGKTAAEAKRNLLHNRPWIEECGFDVEEIICKQLLTDENIADIQHIIEYLMKDEYKHYLEFERPEDHIYITLKRLNKILVHPVKRPKF
ncbi:MAG: hypothetical protein II248_00080 [Paludibacteraceae bacterium]|nr:hypothetical protein [Paludibacteraceae bacterium]MBQ5918300.1 hypothetical protein [Lachnospiraceae bacterium]